MSLLNAPWVRNTASVIVAAMVTAMFIIWVALGPQTIAKQNTAILEGVQGQLDHAANQFGVIVRNQDLILKENRKSLDAIVCILRIEPADRTADTVNACLVDIPTP
jgi:hypothetical protein